MRLLPERAPSTISGRELAAEAGVNYGLVHHYFGTKDEVLRAGLVALRDDFIGTHDDAESLGLLIDDAHPYLRALVRSQLDQPDLFAADGEYPLGRALVGVVSKRLTATPPADGAPDLGSEAKARVIAMVSMQLCYSVFGAALLDATDVGRHERRAVEAALAELYDDLALMRNDDGR